MDIQRKHLLHIKLYYLVNIRKLNNKQLIQLLQIMMKFYILNLHRLKDYHLQMSYLNNQIMN